MVAGKSSALSSTSTHIHSLTPVPSPQTLANENRLLRLFLGESYLTVNPASPQVLTWASSYQGHEGLTYLMCKNSNDGPILCTIPGYKERQVWPLRSSQLVPPASGDSDTWMNNLHTGHRWLAHPTQFTLSQEAKDVDPSPQRCRPGALFIVA